MNTWLTDIDSLYRKRFKKFQENTWKTIDSLNKTNYKDKEFVIKYYRDRLQNLKKAYENYLHLKERYRHGSKIGQIKSDWKAYLDAIGNIDDSQWVHENLWDNNSIDKVDEKENNSKIVIEEIEKRFKNYLKN